MLFLNRRYNERNPILSMSHSERVAVFIDNSNLFHNLTDLAKIDAQWVRLYDPLHLAKRLAGKRTFAYIGFYCTRPPSYLLEDGAQERRAHGSPGWPLGAGAG